MPLLSSLFSVNVVWMWCNPHREYQETPHLPATDLGLNGIEPTEALLLQWRQALLVQRQDGRLVAWLLKRPITAPTKPMVQPAKLSQASARGDSPGLWRN